MKGITQARDRAFANARHNRNKDPHYRIPSGAAKYIGYQFTEGEEPDERWEITDMYFSVVQKVICFDYRNCDASKDQEPNVAQFREFLHWPDLELFEPAEGGGSSGELSEYEKLRQARMEANTAFIAGLGLS